MGRFATVCNYLKIKNALHGNCSNTSVKVIQWLFVRHFCPRYISCFLCEGFCFMCYCMFCLNVLVAVTDIACYGCAAICAHPENEE